jgi:hypothetical protein
MMTTAALLIAAAIVALGLRGWLARRELPRKALQRLEREVTGLRADVAGYRAAHQNSMESFDRRLAGLEQTTAQAALEVRMASGQLMAQSAVERGDQARATA